MIDFRDKLKLLCAGTLVILIGLGLFLALRPQSRAGPKQWLFVSAPVLGSRITPTGAVPTVSLIISNAGPRTLEPSLSWFECRGKTGLARMADNEGWRQFPSLSPKRATTVTCDLPQAFSVGDDPLFCCEIAWFERGSFARRKAQALALSNNANIRPWNIDWMRPWHSKPLTNGVAFASNVAVADYFRSVYGMDEAYFERTMRHTNASLATNRVRVRYGLSPGGDAELTNRAWSHYLMFRRSQ